MSKICPYTNCPVLYLDCLECDDRSDCFGQLKRAGVNFANNDTYNVSHRQNDSQNGITEVENHESQ